ncbi:MAG: UPF0236 family protein [Spirochaetaceae bacterium]|nr:UPF0236 family protein [Spirochaetaceae bacterium]
MNIISLFNSFVNHLNNILDNNLFLHELENHISNSTNSLNLDILKEILEYLDLEYKNSKQRKELYYVQQTRPRTLITSLGLITFNKTYYKSKKKINGKYQYYSYLEDYLGIDKWAKLSLSCEVNLINNALDNGMSWASNNTIPHYIISRQTISTKIKNINYNYIDTSQKRETPKVLYIEADEVHANLQSRKKEKKNKIVPVILTHEGHKEDFVKKKELKNTHYIASSILKTDKLWEETYKYLDTVYDLNKVDKIFLSSDGGTWIKGYDIAFPNAIFVLDKFHYKKALNYIFKREPIVTEIADSYLRNRMVDEFKMLVKSQCQIYPDQKKEMIKRQKYLINHIDGIINQNHPDYKCPCSMEGHISNKYAKFITSRPHSYSLDGLENITQLLTMKANNIKLTEEIYHKFKAGESTYKKLNLEKFITCFKNQAKQIVDNNLKYNLQYEIDNSTFSLKDNYRTNYFLSKRM